MLAFAYKYFERSYEMPNEEDLFAIVYGNSPETDVEKLRQFEWNEVVAQINGGEVSNKITWVMNTQTIPSEYDEKKLKEKYLQNYRSHLKSLIENNTLK